jgi:tRNA U34 5-methylaminomethyl-2-thiouridine-forming methyltransferase MnmC
MSDLVHWTPQLTKDGSFTFFSKEFRESFHSREGAKAEAFQKFAAATDLTQLGERGSVQLLDVCYGLGYNTAAALELIWKVNPTCHIEIHALELDETVPLAAIAPPLIDSWSAEVQEILKAIALEHHCVTPRLSATLLMGDARQTIQSLRQSGYQSEAILLDPFSPRRCPQLWTVEFVSQLAKCLSPAGKLATYSRSASVRAAMREAGLNVGTIPSQPSQFSHEWAQGTVGSFDAQKLHPLSVMEQEHLQTRAAIPYRDPDLCDSAAVILERHHQEQQRSTCESTSSWRRRWGID